MKRFIKHIFDSSNIPLDYEKALEYFSKDNEFVEDLIINELVLDEKVSKEAANAYFDYFLPSFSFKMFKKSTPEQYSTEFNIISTQLKRESVLFFIKSIEEDISANSLNKDGCYYPLWFHLILANILSHALRFKLGKSDKNPLFIFSCPPGAGKSNYSMYFAILLTAHIPESKSIYTSYNDDILKTQGLVFDIIVQSREFQNLFFNIFPAGKDTDFKAALSKRGNKIPSDNALIKATHFGGAIVLKTLNRLTGIRATGCIIGDDLISGSDAISSDKIMNSFRDNFYSSMLTRITDDTVIGLVNTRWSNRDAAGLMLVANKEVSQKFDVENYFNIKNINIQSISTESHLNKDYEFRIKSGDYFWEAHIRKIVLAQTNSNEALFQALYQGLTLEESGNVFKSEYFDYSKTSTAVIKEMLEFKHEIVISVDATFNDNKTSDKVAIAVLAMTIDTKNAILIELVNKRMSFLETLECLRDLIKKYPMYSSVIVESKANGAAIIESLEQNYKGIVAIKPTESKVARARAATPVFSQNMFICDEKYYHDVRKQFVEFTGSDNGIDDIVDSICQALNHYKGFFFDNYDKIITFQMKDDISNVKSPDLFSRYGLNFLK